MDLFDYMREQNMQKQNEKGEGPLASRLRPETLDEIVMSALRKPEVVLPWQNIPR